MAEEFVLLDSAPTAALGPTGLPDRYARAVPNPLPLFPRLAQGGARPAGWVLAMLLTLGGVVYPAGAALWFASRDARIGPPGEPTPAPPTPDDDPLPPPVSDPVRSEPVVVADGLYPDIHAEWRSYRLSATGGETIKVEVRFAADGRDLHLELLDASGAQVGRHDWIDGGASITWRVERDEVFSLNVANPGQLRHDLIVSRVADGFGLGRAPELAASVAGSHHLLGPFHEEHGLLVAVRFSHAAGDVDARLLDEQGEVLAEGVGTTDVERLFVREARRCRELVLYRADNVADVEMQRVDRLHATSRQSLSAPCAGWVSVRAGQVLQATAWFSHAEGDVELELIAGGEVVANSITSSDQEEVRWAAPADQDVVLRLFRVGEPVAPTSAVELEVVIR